MSALPFFSKLEMAKEYSLQDIPVFSSLSLGEQKLIEKKARLIEYKRGDIVYHEGSPSDAFYVVISGRFQLFTKNKLSLVVEVLLNFYRGDHFGETSLLTGKPHSASVEAKNDGVILKLDKDEFLKLLQDMPAISLHLSRSLGHRLTRDEAAAKRREVKIVALSSEAPTATTLRFWIDFAASLSQESKRKVVIVDFIVEQDRGLREEFQKSLIPSFDLEHKEPSREADLKACLVGHSSGFQYLHVCADEAADKYEKKITTLLTFLTYRFDYLMLRLPSELSHTTFKTLKQTDVIYTYTDCTPQAMDACAIMLQEFQKTFGFSKSDIRVLMPENEKTDKMSFEMQEKIFGIRVFSIIPKPGEKPERYKGTLRYLSKELAGTLVGLAFGSGAAYGLAHIGVLKVIEEEGIEVDVIAGSSIGAFVGAFWCAGYSSTQLSEIARSIDKKTGFFKLIGFQDLSAAHRGFFKGHQIAKYMESYLGDKTFQDLEKQLRVVATDLNTSEGIVFDSGRLVDAIRASISIPGIFRPVTHRGQYLIDGGVADPLPVGILASMGVKKIIAVNVLAGPKDLLERNRIWNQNSMLWLESLEKKNFMSRLFSLWVRRFLSRYSLNVFNVIMNTIQFMEFELADVAGKRADVLIHPVVPDGHWAEFYHADKFIKAGEDKAREQLAEIKRLLVE